MARIDCGGTDMYARLTIVYEKKHEQILVTYNTYINGRRMKYSPSMDTDIPQQEKIDEEIDELSSIQDLDDIQEL
jgi:hypothetical protein